MTASERKRASNRANAQRSGGPTGQQAKLRVRRNAWKHGLAALTLQDPAVAAQVDQLALAICGRGADCARREQARIIAECELMLTRVHAARLHVLERNLAARPGHPPGAALSCSEPDPATLEDCLGRLARIDRYERRCLSRRKRAVRSMMDDQLQ